MNFSPLEIDRGIVWRLQKVISDMGYWPDIDTFMPEPINQAAFQTAIDTIVAAGKTPIQVFNPASPKDRLEVKGTHFVVRRAYVEPGRIGYGSSVGLVQTVTDQNNPQNNRWQKSKFDETTVDIEYEIRFVAATGEEHRISDQILVTAFGMRKHLLGRNANRSAMTTGFEITTSGTPTDLDSADFIERMYRFRVQDVIIGTPEVVVSTIVPATRIDVGVQTKKEITDINNIDNDDLFTTIIN